MIAWFTAAALAAPAPELGFQLGPDVLAVRESARHDVAVGLRGSFTYSPRPWSTTVELMWAPRADHSDLLTYRTHHLAASALFEQALSPYATVFRAGIGPAVVMKASRFDLGSTSGGAARFEGGARLRVALDGPITGPLAWGWHTGMTIHPSGTDWDTGLSVGVMP